MSVLKWHGVVHPNYVKQCTVLFLMESIIHVANGSMYFSFSSTSYTPNAPYCIICVRPNLDIFKSNIKKKTQLMSENVRVVHLLHTKHCTFSLKRCLIITEMSSVSSCCPLPRARSSTSPDSVRNSQTDVPRNPFLSKRNSGVLTNLHRLLERSLPICLGL